ncbi:MAG: GreA/GreB family elongation factor, partial [Polyangiaceae bacterium]|nr:GreA/GreB family elongation factor [Polyangiaceae bacterium]
PMGQALVGRSKGDEIELRSRGTLREYEIVAVR